MFTLTTHMLFAKPQRVSQLALPKKKKKKNEQILIKTKNNKNKKSSKFKSKI